MTPKKQTRKQNLLHVLNTNPSMAKTGKHRKTKTLYINVPEEPFWKKVKQLEMSQQALPKQRKRENANCKKKSKKVIHINFCLV